MRYRRRSILQIAASLPVLGGLGGAACGTPRAAPRFLDDEQRAKVERLADLVFPPDDTPGATALGAVDYIDRLLSGEGLFFGSGPFSGRTPFPDERGLPSGEVPRDAFADAEPLDRVQFEAMRALLYGDDGLRALFTDNLKKVGPHTQLEDLDTAFLDKLVQLVCEGCFAAPEYGGNHDMKGWRLVHFEGDQMPLGFTTFDETRGVYREREGASTSAKDDALDPDPIDEDVAKFLSTAIAFLGGRDTKAS